MGTDWRNIKGQGVAGSSSRLPSRKQLMESNSLNDTKSTEVSTNMSMDELSGVDSASGPSTSRAVEVTKIIADFSEPIMFAIPVLVDFM